MKRSELMFILFVFQEKFKNYFDKTLTKDVFNLTGLKLLFSILLVT